MNIVQFQRFDKDGIELVIDTYTGESFATVSGYSRMAGKAKSTVSERFGSIPLGEAQIQTQQGLRTVRLIPGKLATSWLAKDNPELLAAMSEVGWNVYCHKLAGFEIKSAAIANVPKSYGEALLEAGRLQLELEKSEAEKALLEEENQLLAEAVDELFEYSSIIRIAKFNDMDEKAFHWRKLKSAVRVMGLEIKRVPCPRFGEKLLYPHDAWRFCYPDVRLPETTTLVIGKN